MKVLILAGGLGTRLSEETYKIPKPMVEIGGKPILWHIMKTYSSFGYNDFVILLGYKGYLIKEYFVNYLFHQNDLVVDMQNDTVTSIDSNNESWRVTLIDTGENSMTGGRIKRAQEIVGDQQFFLTYGDGVSDINIDDLLKAHNNYGGSMTMTSVQPDGRFGTFEAKDNGQVSSFIEKPSGQGSWINGGYFVCEPDIFNYIKNGDMTVFEEEPLQDMANDDKLFTYKHNGFWKCMDTLKDKNDLNEMIATNGAPWINW